MGNAIYDFFMGDTVRRNNYLYDTPHLITLIAVLVCTVSLVLFARRMNTKQKRSVMWVFFGILLTFEVISRIVNLAKGNDPVTTIVPMHFCSIMVWVMILAVATNHKHLLNIAAMGGLIATMAFLVHPAVGFNVEVLKFSQYYSVISHCLGFMLSVFMLFSGFVSYKWKEFWVSALFMGLVYLYSYFQNFVWYPGSNYMYYMENLLPISNTWFLVLYSGFVVTYVLSFYTINSLVTIKKQKRNQK